MERKNSEKPAGKEKGAAAPVKKHDRTKDVKAFAYLLYEKRGYAHGFEMQDWLEAEKKVNGR